jgi:hypothetical protein
VRPPIDQAAISLILDGVPEFGDRCQDLLALYADELTPAAVMVELAEYVSYLFRTGDQEDSLESCFLALEAVAERVAGGEDLVMSSFLADLPSDVYLMSRSYLGRIAAGLAEKLEADEGAES